MYRCHAFHAVCELSSYCFRGFLSDLIRPPAPAAPVPNPALSKKAAPRKGTKAAAAAAAAADATTESAAAAAQASRPRWESLTTEKAVAQAGAVCSMLLSVVDNEFPQLPRDVLRQFFMPGQAWLPQLVAALIRCVKVACHVPHWNQHACRNQTCSCTCQC